MRFPVWRECVWVAVVMATEFGSGESGCELALVIVVSGVAVSATCIYKSRPVVIFISSSSTVLGSSLRSCASEADQNDSIPPSRAVKPTSCLCSPRNSA